SDAAVVDEPVLERQSAGGEGVARAAVDDELPGAVPCVLWDGAALPSVLRGGAALPSVRRGGAGVPGDDRGAPGVDRGAPGFRADPHGRDESLMGEFGQGLG